MLHLQMVPVGCADFSSVCDPNPRYHHQLQHPYVTHRLRWYAQRLTEERERALDLDLAAQRQQDRLTAEVRRLAADLEAARQQLADLQDRFTCAVCMEAPRSRAPRCGHFLMCESCAARAKKCPVCRINYSVTKPVFFS